MRLTRAHDTDIFYSELSRKVNVAARLEERVLRPVAHGERCARGQRGNDKPSLSDFFFRLLDFGVRKLGNFKRVYLVAYTPYLHAAEAEILGSRNYFFQRPARTAEG